MQTAANQNSATLVPMSLANNLAMLKRVVKVIANNLYEKTTDTSIKKVTCTNGTFTPNYLNTIN
jgi:hypothetical protein